MQDSKRKRLFVHQKQCSQSADPIECFWCLEVKALRRQQQRAILHEAKFVSSGSNEYPTQESLKRQKLLRETLAQSRFHSVVDALYEMEQGGAAPVCEDGKVGGNGACLIPLGDKTLVIVSKTGKYSGRMDIHRDFCLVENFDKESWAAEFYSESSSVRPTSDSPLHYTVLHLQKQLQWMQYPTATLHGHALETAEKAEKADIPCSHEETLFSTPGDSQALVDLMKKYPYPKYKIYIRKNHGFFIAGNSIDETLQVFKDKVLPYSDL